MSVLEPYQPVGPTSDDGRLCQRHCCGRQERFCSQSGNLSNGAANHQPRALPRRTRWALADCKPLEGGDALLSLIASGQRAAPSTSNPETGRTFIDQQTQQTNIFVTARTCWVSACPPHEWVSECGSEVCWKCGAERRGAR